MPRLKIAFHKKFRLMVCGFTSLKNEGRVHLLLVTTSFIKT